MRRSKRLQPVLRIAELDVDKAAKALMYMQQKLSAESGKLQQLQQYLLECRSNMVSSGKQGMSAQQLMIFTQFTQKVDVAILQQQEQIALVTQQVTQVKAYWQQQDIRYRSLEKMVEKIETEEKAAQGRQEQKNHDEYARRSGARGPWQ